MTKNSTPLLNWAAGAIILGFALVQSLTLSDYGVTWDTAYGEIFLGDKYFHFYRTGDAEFLDLSQPNIEIYQSKEHPDFQKHSWYAVKNVDHIWPLGPILSAASKHLLFTQLGLLDPIDAHHAVLVPLMALFFVVVFRFVRDAIGPAEALICLLVIAVHPRIFSHAHYNLKDIPSLAFFTLALVSFYFAVKNRTTWGVLASGACWGLALATKGNALFLPAILVPWLVCLTVSRAFRRENVGSVIFLSSFFIYPAVAFLIFLFCWPYLLLNFPSNLLSHVGFLVDRGLEGPPYWQLLPTIKLIATTPLMVLCFSVFGLLASIARAWKEPDFRWNLFLLVLWLSVPIIRISAPQTHDFDGIRHWLEVQVPLSVFAAFGILTTAKLCSALMLRLKRSLKSHKTSIDRIGVSLFSLIALSPALYWNIQNHPFQVVFFNDLVDRLPGAQRDEHWGLRFDAPTDYWGASYRKGMEWLNENVEPNSIVMVPIAPHILNFYPKSWIREDLRIEPLSTLKQRIDGGDLSSPMYLMYVTRERGKWYKGQSEEMRYFRQLDKTKEPIKEFTVDGGIILKIISVPRATAQL